MFLLLLSPVCSRVWLCSTWGRSYCSGSAAEWEFSGSDDLKAVFHPKCFYNSVSTPELGFAKEEVQHYNGEMHPLLPAHHHTTPLLLKHQQGSNQHHTHIKLSLHTHTFLCSVLPIQLLSKTIRKVQNEGLPTAGHTHKPLGMPNLGSLSSPLCRGSSRAARAQQKVRPWCCTWAVPAPAAAGHRAAPLTPWQKGFMQIKELGSSDSCSTPSFREGDQNTWKVEVCSAVL